MFFRKQLTTTHDPLLESELFDEQVFYQKFIRDLINCQHEVIIESPYITSSRTDVFIPIFRELLNKHVKIYVLTRDPREHEEGMAIQAEQEIVKFENLGISTFLCKGNDHRKLAILDRKILWEGSLNILSQTFSREIMRRIDSHTVAMQMFNFLDLGKHIERLKWQNI